MQAFLTGCFTKLLLMGAMLFLGAVATWGVLSAATAPRNMTPAEYVALERDQLKLESERKQAEIAEAERLDSYARNRVFWDNVVGVGSIIFPAILIGLPLGLMGAALDAYLKRREPLVWPRLGDKVLPLPRQNLLDDVHSDLMLEALTESNTTARVLGRTWPNVPQTLTLTNTAMPALESGEDADEEGIDVPPDELPGPFEMSALLTTGWRPSMDNIIQGVGIGRKVVSDKLVNLLHMAVTGETNRGKSNMVRFFLAQILYAGAEVYLLDTHYADLDPVSGDDWRPIRRRLAGGRAINQEQEIYATIKNLRAEIKRRLYLREQGKHPGRPVFYVIEELPSITKQYPDFMEHLGFALREGRKIQVYIIVASQTLLISTIGGDSGIRTQFQTRFYAGGDAATYAALFPRCKIAEPDQKGIVILKSAATGAPTTVRVPYVANDTLWNLLAPDQKPATVTVEPVRPALTLVPPRPIETPSGRPLGTVPVEMADALARLAQAHAPTTLDEGETQALPAVEAAPPGLPPPLSFDWAADEAKRQLWISQKALTAEEAERACNLYLAGIEPARILLEMRGIDSNKGITYQANLAATNEGIRQELARRGMQRYVINATV